MAILGSNVLTLTDWAKRLDPNGQVPTIVELLSQTNEILTDALWAEGNLPTGHRTTMRTGLPTVAWRKLNQGVQPSKSTTVQTDDQCGMLEAYSEVDKDLAELNGNVGAFRMSEAVAFIEAMNQNQAITMFYGDTAIDPEQYLGLAPRYSSLSAENGSNIIDAGGTGSDNTSIWLICWGGNTAHGIFPKASKAGLMQEDLGLVTVETTSGIAGSRMRAYRDHWQWKCGLSLRDWRYVVRIANIDISLLIADEAGTTVKLLFNMVRALHRLPTMSMGKCAFYCNRTVREMLDIQAMSKASNQLTLDTVDGKLQTSFRGIPIRTCDALLETEARVV